MQDASDHTDLDLAETLLLQFVSDFEELYNLRFVVMNAHKLVHLADSARKSGVDLCLQIASYLKISMDLLCVIYTGLMELTPK